MSERYDNMVEDYERIIYERDKAYAKLQAELEYHKTLTAAQQRVAELLLLITTVYNGLHRGIGPMASASDGEIASTINDTMHNIFGNEWKTQ